MSLTQALAGSTTDHPIEHQWRQLLGQLLDAVPCGAALFDPEQRLIEANAAFRDLIDMPAAGGAVIRLGELVAAPDQARLHEILTHTSSPTDHELRLQAGAEEPRRALVRFTRITLVQEELILLFVLTAPPDHASALPAPLAIPDTEGDAAQAFARVANWVLDLTTWRIQGSRAWYDIWGTSPDEPFTLEDLYQRLLPEDRLRVAAAVRKACEQRTPFRLRHRFITPDGRLRWAESACRPDPDPSIALRRLSGIVLDISHRHEAELMLARYQDIVSASPDRLAFLDRGCRLQTANEAFLTAVQGTLETTVGRCFHELVGPGPVSDCLYRHLARCLDMAEITVEDVTEPARDGTTREFELRLVPHRDAQGLVSGIVVNLRDVTNVRESERYLLQTAAVYAATSDAVIITDATTRIVAVNDAFTRITGYAKDEVMGQRPSMLDSQWHSRAFHLKVWRCLLKTGSWQGEIWNRRKDGEIVLHSLSLRRIQDARGQTTNYVGVFADRRTAMPDSRGADDFVLYDPLTKLPNRILLVSRLAHAIDPSPSGRAPIALALLDIDHFDHINASLGHRIGDELLRAIALRLRESIRATDVLGRWGSNQFGLLFDGVGSTQEAQILAERLLDCLKPSLTVRRHHLFVAASIGVTLESGPESDVESLICRAEAALHLAKRAGGRSALRILHEHTDVLALERLEPLGRLRDALTRGELRLYFQPRVELETGRWMSVQTQLRWQHPVLGLVRPEEILPLADATVALAEIGHWVIAEACRQFRAWDDRGVAPRSLTLTLSEAQLTGFDLISTLERLLQGCALNGERIELEVPAALMFKHPEQSKAVCAGLRRLGVALTLSEAGTGWLAPAWLRLAAIDKVKIHARLIESMTESDDDLVLTEALVAMAQALELAVIADGVTTARQRHSLMSMGCLEAVGELLAPPMSPAQFEQALLETRLQAPTRRIRKQTLV
ncbi:MAG: EAL domain-containing protein [Sphingobacteriia bacterium]|nr:EAL domain-containing protein [Sphingobacteriia bacterium]NCC39850.1 EAL domain-containing protein [Gammaproteobacteria bacterium]